MTILTVSAPAKLNLSLQIVGKRADGYHLLDSLVAFTEYGDTIDVAAASDLRFQVAGPFAPVLDADDAENLVLRAARLLAEAAGVPARAEITLTKRLPVASGIGGGSSDAAAALIALRRLWQLDIADTELAVLGLRLGADVPVCLLARGARLQGIGEQISAVPNLPAAPILLVNPGIGLPTPQVFARRSGAFSTAPSLDDADLAVGTAELAHSLKAYPNDLTEAAISVLPVIADILNTLEGLDGCLIARMSGSGATCFALFSSESASAAAAASLAQNRPDWWCVATRLWERSAT